MGTEGGDYNSRMFAEFREHVERKLAEAQPRVSSGAKDEGVEVKPLKSILYRAGLEYLINFTLFIIGMIIVAVETNWNTIAMLGAFIASIHVTLVKNENLPR